jgi:hypothetical protein
MGITDKDEHDRITRDAYELLQFIVRGMKEKWKKRRIGVSEPSSEQEGRKDRSVIGEIQSPQNQNLMQRT